MRINPTLSMLRYASALLISLLATSLSYSQLNVNNGFTAQQLGNNLAGNNVNVFNATISGDPNQYGTFQYLGNDLGLNSGVILSTGDIFDAVGPNNDNGTSSNMGGPGDTDLSALAGFNTNDAVVFEFDFEVQGDEIEFNFVFLSEEYNEWVNSGFNDVFAFYISGPGIVGQQNLAVVPGTTTPVTINTINNGSFWQFYNDNTNGAVNIEFDGFTTLMTAYKNGLQACGIYTLSLRIADGSDSALDSGVLLEENSLIQAGISATSTTFSANNTALEGCIEASFTFQLDSIMPVDVNIPISVAGTATNGVDYAQIDSLITIPAGQLSATLIIDAIADGLAEGQEIIELYYTPSPCQPQDTVYLYIDDYTPLEYEVSPTDITCAGALNGTVDLTVTGGIPPYTLTLTDSITGDISIYNNFPVTGLDQGTYYVEVIDGYGCTAEDIVAGNLFDAGQTFIPDGQGQSWSSTINLAGFGAGATVQSADQIQSICATMEHSRIGELLIEIISPGGQSVILKEQPGGNITNMGEPCAIGPTDGGAGPGDTLPGIGYNYCWQPIATYGTMVAESGNYTYTYTNPCDGSTQSDKYLPSGSYLPYESFDNFIGQPLNGGWTITVTDEIPNNNGYIFNWSISLQADPPDSVFTINEPAGPSISHVSTNPDCGVNNGSIDLTVSGGAAPFTFLWNTGATTEDISGITAGTYTVDITDDSSCVHTYQVNLSNNGTLVITGSATNEICADQNNGAIDVTITGGTGPFTYSWNTGQTTEGITGLSPSTYTITVQDAGGCQGSESFVVSAAPNINIDAVITNEHCGDAEGIIDITLYGALNPVTYNWSNGDITQDINELTAGTYFVNLTDANGCAATDTFTVINLVGNCVPNCDLSITASTVVNENCGNSNGSINLTTFTTNGPTLFNWNTGAVSEDLFGLSQGTYIVTISDNEGCEVIDTFNLINQTSGLQITNTNVTNEYCGGSQGAIDISVSGGAMPYTYNWSNGSTTQDLNGISAGTYSLTITDANGCALNYQVTVINDAGTLVQTYGNAVNEVCSNGAGSIDISIQGGQTPYTYNWSNGATSQDLVGLSAGNYSCVITDAGGCSISTPLYTINNQSGSMAFSLIDVDNEICTNALGSIELLFGGGTAPYTVQWNTGATTQDIFNLSAGTYSATVTDNSGCSINTGNLVLLNESGTLSLTNVQTFDELCGNGTGSINISIAGGTAPITYQWNTGSSSQDISNLNAGNYNCTITDINGCTVYASGTIMNNPGVLNVDNIIVTDDNCGQSIGALDAIISGAIAPITYNWSNGASTEDISGLTSGTYTIQVTDNNGCSTSASANVNNLTNGISLDDVQLTNEICGAANGSIDLIVSGGTAPITYSWSSGQTSEDLNGIIAGVYTCTITDNTGCSIIAGPYTINNSSGGLSLSVASIAAENCGNNDGAININTTGGTAPYAYSWSNGASTEDINSLSAGTYSLLVTGSNGCSTSISVEVPSSSGTLDISSFIVVDEICGNAAGAIDISVTGGTLPYTYLWSNTSITEDVTGLASGPYNVTVSDASGCSINSSVIAVNNNAGTFSVNGINVINEVCSDGMGNVDLIVTGATGSVSYLWSNGATTQDLNNITEGSYSGTATDVIGCTVSFSATVGNDAGSMIVSTSVSDATCGQSNGSIDLIINGGTAPYAYLWSNGSTSEDISGLVSNNYTCNISDASGCSADITVMVNNASGPIITGANVTDESCGSSDGSIVINTSGGVQPFTYSWTTPPTPPCCTYTLDMQDQGNSWNGASVTVVVDGTQVGNFTVSGGGANTETFNVCDGESIELLWNSGGFDNEVSFDLLDATNTIIFSQGASPTPGSIWTGTGACAAVVPTGNTLTNIAAGTYSVVVTDANGCQDSTVVIIDNTSGSLAFLNEIVTNETCTDTNGAIDITVTGANPFTFNWDNGATTEDVTDLSAGTYSVTVVDNDGCTINGSYTLIDINNGLAITSSSITDENCGDGTGAIDITTTGGIGPLSYNWSNGYTAEDILSLNSGSYTVTISDGSVCDYVETFIVSNNANGMNSTAVITDEYCGNSDGGIDITMAGGTAPYSYLWSNGDISEDLSGISAGTYTVQITDNLGCMYTDSYVVDLASGGISITSNVIDEDCGAGDGSINITVSGGSGVYSYNWSNGATTQDINNLAYGIYTVVVTDDQGCTATLAENVASTGSFNYNSNITVENCSNANGAINLTFFGFNQPDAYSWSNGATTQDISGLSEGWYTVVIQSFGFGSCEMVDSFYVGSNQGTVSIDDIVVTHESCSFNDGALNATISGGNMPYSYLWSNGATTEDITGLAGGIYNLTVTDANGCSASMSQTVNSYTYGFGIAGAAITDEQCGDGMGAIDITVSGGLAPVVYSWSSGQLTEDLSSLSAGMYTVTLVDATGCSVENTFEVVNITNGFSAVAVVTDETCGNTNGAIDVTITGGAAPIVFLWNTGALSEDLSGLDGGNYSCTITDNTGCAITINETVVSFSEVFDIGTPVITDENCGDSTGSILLNPNGGTAPFTYNWDLPDPCCSYTLNMYDLNNNGWGGNPAPYVTVFINGVSYGDFTVPTGNGNSFAQEIIPICDGDQLQFEYVQAAQNQNNTYEVLDSEGNIVFQDGPNPFNGIAFTTSASCSAGNVNQLTDLTSGVYTVEILDAVGCSIQDTFVINNNTGSFVITSASLADETCTTANGSIDLTVSGGVLPYTFSWSNGASTEDVSGLSAGTYNVTITDANGCSMSASYTLNNDTGGLTFDAAILTDETCENSNGAIDVSVTGGTLPYSYSWDSGETTEDLTGIGAGSYNLTVTDGTGCSIITNYTIVNQGASVNVQNVSITDATCSTCADGIINLTMDPAGAPYTYSWNTGATVEDLVNLNPGTYTVTITNNDGCVSTIDYVVLDVASLNENNEVVFIISPNPSDGIFNLSFSSFNGTEMNLVIFDASGRLVLSNTINVEESQFTYKLNLTALSKGSYILELTGEKIKSTKRLVIQH